MESEWVLERPNGTDATSKLKRLRLGDGGVTWNGVVVEHIDNVNESEDLEVGLLNDLDSYLEDIDDRLAVSRMVNDSVTRGVICAVEQEAAEKIAQKESELARLKETLLLYHVATDADESVRLPIICQQQRTVNHGCSPVCSDALLEHDMFSESLDELKISVEEQLKSLTIEINKVKGFSSIGRKGSSSELLGLSGILPEMSLYRWSDVDNTLNGLRTTFHSAYKQFEDMVHLSKSSLFQWQQEREFQAEIEGTVIKTCIGSLQEEFEQRLQDHNARFCSDQRIYWLAKFKELSTFRQELDSIHKSLPSHENGHLISHGSLEHRKGSGNYASSTNVLWEGNGVNDGSIISSPENVDLAQLKHMTWQELANYFKSEMTKMKRHHELKVQEMTEQYFILKREYLKERDSSFPAKKDKEGETLRKKISELIMKLDNIIEEKEKLPAFNENVESLGKLNGQLESLRCENHQLKELLAGKREEMQSLSLQVSDASDRIRQQSLAEDNLMKMIADLESALEDAQIDTLVSEDIFRLLIKGVMSPMKCFRESANNTELITLLQVEDSNIDAIVAEGVCQVVYKETLREAEEKYTELRKKFMSESKIRLSLEMETLEKGNALRLGIAEKESLEQELLSLRAKIDEKDNLLRDAINELAKEREKSGLVSEELHGLRIAESQQQLLIAKSREESQVIRCNLAEALENVERYRGEEIDKLRERLYLVTKSLHDASRERDILLASSQQKESSLSITEARDTEIRKQMNSVIVLVNSLSTALTDLESRATKDIQRNSLRLQKINCEFSSLIQMADTLRKTGLTYKKKLERRSSDLQKAENEVDLLGDEVDALLSLLEKIYIALDHYSPILQHYPGIMEILKLVRRELSGEAVKPI